MKNAYAMIERDGWLSTEISPKLFEEFFRHIKDRYPRVLYVETAERARRITKIVYLPRKWPTAHQMVQDALTIARAAARRNQKAMRLLKERHRGAR